MLGMTSTSIGGINKGFGGTQSGRLNDSSFLGASKLNYGDDNMPSQDEHSLKVRRLLEKVRKMINNNNTQ